MSTDVTIIDPDQQPPDPGPGKLATQSMRGRLPINEIVEAARAMAKSDLIPFVLRRSNTPETIVGNCYVIISQALAWGMDPMSVASQVYVVDGKLGYQGRLIAALVNTRADLKGKLQVEFTGEGQELTCTVTGEFRKEKKPRTKTLRFRDVIGKSELWKKDPQNKLWYTTVLAWAALHWPEGTLAITDHEAEETIVNVTPIKEESNRENPTHGKNETPRTPPAPLAAATGEVASKTLQEALADEQKLAEAKDGGGPDDHIDFFLMQQIHADRDILFDLKGLTKQREDDPKREAAWANVLKKRGCASTLDLTNAQAKELHANILAQIDTAYAARKNAAPQS